MVIGIDEKMSAAVPVSMVVSVLLNVAVDLPAPVTSAPITVILDPKTLGVGVT